MNRCNTPMKMVAFLLLLLSATHPPTCMGADNTSSEKTIAVEFLKSRGITKAVLSLSKEVSGDNYVVYGSSHCFVIMEKKRLFSVLSNPILAYSAESDFPKENSTMIRLLKYYDEQLSLLEADSVREYEYPEGFDYNKCSPILLGDINQNQAHLQRKIENHKAFTVLAGCGPCAMSQVIEYHKFPTSVHDTVSFHDITNQANYEKVLDRMPSFPAKGTLGSGAVENLQILCGYAAHISFGMEGSSSYTYNVQMGLIHHFGYNPKITSWYPLSKPAVSAIYDDIDRKLPCIMSGCGHLFVCDGYQGEFLHLNMGWGKHGNGYYRITIAEGTRPPFQLLTGIEPDTLGVKEMEITVEQPGSLHNRWKESVKEMSDVSSLKVKGNLNGWDLYALRAMSSGQGRLSRLDLSKAKFYVASPKSQYDIYILPQKAFVRCYGLREVYLPDSLVMIAQEAFNGCNGLREIYLPPTVRYVDIRGFANTERLRRVYYKKDYTRFLVGKDKSRSDDAVFYKSCPTLKLIGY